AGFRLYANGRAEGPALAHGDLAPCAAQCADADHHRYRHPDRLSDRRAGRGRDAVSLPGHRLTHLHRGARQGFSGAGSRHPHHRHRLCGGAADRRPCLFDAQPPYPAGSRAMSAADIASTPEAPRSRARETLAAFGRSGSFLIGGAIVLFWIACALFGEHFAPYDPLANDIINSLAPPSAEHWFGTDQLGRDVFSRVIVGSRDILTVAPLATLLATLFGTALGLLTGYFRGLIDDIV